MPSITFITPSGERRQVDASTGDSLMEAAVENGIEGIDADCGGVCSCATCHVRIPAEWRERVGEQNSSEADLLELEDKADQGSRLSCQMEVTDALDGLVVEVVKLH